jgi:hypothetical protein
VSATALGARGVALIDVNNVRGRLGFRRADEARFCAALARFALDARLGGRVLAAVDHGPRARARVRFPLVLEFAGPRWTADDCIVRAVGWLAAGGHADPIVVVTSDRLLRQRCRAAVAAAARTAGSGPASTSGHSGGGGGGRAGGSAARLKLVASTELADALEAAALRDALARPAPGWEAIGLPPPLAAEPLSATAKRGAAALLAARLRTSHAAAVESTATREAQAAALDAALEALGAGATPAEADGAYALCAYAETCDF